MSNEKKGAKAEEPTVLVAEVEAAKLKAPKGVKSATFDGQHYDVESDGTIVVPAEAVEALLSHGFEPVAE